MPETRTAISTDRLGIARQNVSYLKLSIPEREFPFRDVEVIGLGPVRRLRGFLYELEQEGFRPVRIHGATGIGQGEANIRRLMLGVFSRMVVPTKRLQREFPKYPCLVHAPEALRIGGSFGVDGRQDDVWIENHEPGMLGVTRSVRPMFFICLTNKPPFCWILSICCILLGVIPGRFYNSGTG